MFKEGPKLHGKKGGKLHPYKESCAECFAQAKNSSQANLKDKGVLADPVLCTVMEAHAESQDQKNGLWSWYGYSVNAINEVPISPSSMLESWPLEVHDQQNTIAVSVFLLFKEFHSLKQKYQEGCWRGLMLLHDRFSG